MRSEDANAAPSEAATLSLDSSKNNSHPPLKPRKGCHVGFAYGTYIQDGHVRGFRGNIPCKKWSCKDCAPTKVKFFKKRLYNGAIMEFVNRKGFRPSKYAFKMLTLTYPGQDYRKRYSPAEALEQMNKAWEKLRKAMTKRWGKFHYLKVTEKQRDGYPHFHILIVGHAIATKKVLDQIRELWVFKYGMGPQLDLQVLKGGLKAGITYVMKYFTKGMEPVADRKRVFTASQGALMKIEKPHRLYLEKGFMLGMPDPDCSGFQSFDLGAIRDLPREGRKELVREFKRFVMAGPVQE